MYDLNLQEAQEQVIFQIVCKMAWKITYIRCRSNTSTS